MKLWKRGPAKERKPRQWKRIRRVYKFAFASATLRACSEAAGFACVAFAGWMFHPIVAALVAGLYFLNLAYAPRSKP